MAKPKPTEVIRHEIVLGRSEKEILDTIATGLTFRNVANPIVALLSDVTALLALTGILELLGIIDLRALAKKAGGWGLNWMNKIKDGAFDTLDEAIEEYYTHIDEKYFFGTLPGGDPLIDPYEVPEEYRLTTSERAWAMTQIYSQQASFTSPADAYM